MNGVQKMSQVQLKNVILDHAWNILKRDGKRSLNMRALAKASECSLGTLYNTFSNFDDIFFHLKVKAFDLLYKRLTTALALQLKKKSPSLDVTMQKLGLAYVGFAKDHFELWKALFETNNYVEFPKWYREYIQGKLKAIEEQLSQAFDVSAEKAHKLVVFFWAVVHGISSITLNRNLYAVEDEIGKKYVDEYIHHCFNGLMS